ncbi:MAG: DUF1223 domain-containing protein [Alphaproteobacteria bacterium]|nr:DUF1223 domain-containing protein [Alphaproteobacteria bacterium]
MNRIIGIIGGVALYMGVALPVLSAERAAIMAELFTSQGCSSCPAADAFLGDLAQRDDVVALSYHVGYWDYTGWKDPFASASNLSRQEAYQRIFGEAYVYTPELVVDGMADMSGNSRAAVLRTIAQAAIMPRVRVTVSRRDDGALVVSVGEGVSVGDDKVWLAAFDRMRKTPVARGENGGRTLINHNIVRTYRAIGSWQGQPVDIVVPAAAWQTDSQVAGGYAAWVQPATLGRIKGAGMMTVDTAPGGVNPSRRDGDKSYISR